MFPPTFEFIVEGPAVSLQTRNKTRLTAWKNQVAAAARSVWPGGLPPAPFSLQISILFFYRGAPIGDLDNFVKPIQDALIGLVYVDDSQITDVVCRRRPADTQYRLEDVPVTLLDGLTLYDDFLYIRLSSAPDPLHLGL